MTQGIFRTKALSKLQSPEQLDQLLSVTTPKGWIALGAGVVLLLAALLWAGLANVQVTTSGRGILVPGDQPGQVDAVLFVSLEDGARIQPGMTAKVAPGTVRQEEYGLIWGAVASVKGMPSTQAEMLRILGNDALVQTLTNAGALIAVQVDLLADPGTPSGYAWTSMQGPPTTIRDGTLVAGAVVVQQVHPISLVFSR